MRPLRHLITALIAIVIAVGVVLPLATHFAPVIGREVLAVRGGSMEPGIARGSLVVISQRTAADLRPGDVITWRGENGVRVTHRIVDAFERDGELMFQTKGDANESPDGFLVPAHAVVGGVDMSVPVAGYALMLLSTPSGLLSWLSFGIALLLADALLSGPRSPSSSPSPASTPAPARSHAAVRRLRRLLPGTGEAGTGWPVHFAGVTVDGNDLGILDVMLRCSNGDHRDCPLDTRPQPIARRGGGGQTVATA